MKIQLQKDTNPELNKHIADITVAMLSGDEVDFRDSESFVMYIASLQAIAIDMMESAILQVGRSEIDIDSFNITFRKHIHTQFKLTDGPRVIEQFVKAYSAITGKLDSTILIELGSVATKTLTDQRVSQLIALSHFGLADLDESITQLIIEEIKCLSK